jgi:excisionase family DNA binding protein
MGNTQKQLVMAAAEGLLDKKKLLAAVKDSLGERRLLNDEDACRYLGIGRTLLYKKTSDNEIPSIKFYGCRRWDVDELDEMIERIKVERDNNGKKERISK